jgi:5-methylcytosine-specific restriction endonuclease McrA
MSTITIDNFNYLKKMISSIDNKRRRRKLSFIFYRPACVCCKEKAYAVSFENDLIRFLTKDSHLTLDHIIPVSLKGKKEAVTNWQVMCLKCNQKKGNRLNFSALTV